jgi:hypothetical protein
LREADLGRAVFILAMALLGIAIGYVVVTRRAPSTGASTQLHHVLQSPYQARPFLRGQLMAQSTRGRGQSLPRDVSREYQRLGYSWFSLTDVNTVDPVNTYDTPGLITLQGEEMQYGFGHFLVYGVDHDELADTPAGVIRWAHRAAGVVFMSRPLQAPTLSLTQLEGLQGLDGIQIYDARVARETPTQADATSVWDQMLSDGHRLWGIVGDDTQSVVGPASTAGVTSLDVQVGSPDPVLIAAALKTGAFVASTGVRVLGISAEQGVVTVVTSDAEQISFIGSGGRVLQRVGGRRGDYHVRWDEGYVRAVASKKDGSQAWTQPVFVIP